MTAREVDKKTLNLFWDLKAEDKKKQTACINKLAGIVRGLLQNNKVEEVPDKAKYCINRLLKGLAAGSDNSRHGFYECLKTVVNSKHFLPVKYFQDAAKEQLQTSGVMTKNELTDFKRGQILANRLIAESEKTGEEAVGSLVVEIAEVGSKKHMLASEAAKAVLAVFDKIPASTFENEVWPSLQPLVCVPMEKQSATRFEIMFKCQERFPTLISSKVLRYTVGCSQLLGPETYPFLVKFLLNCDCPTFPDSLYSRLEATGKLSEFIVAIKESLGNLGKADDEDLRSFILSVIRKADPSILSEILCSSLLELLTKKSKMNEKHVEKITGVVRGRMADSGEDIQWAVSKSLIKAAKEMKIGAQAFGMLQSLLPSLKEEIAKKTCLYLRKIVTDIENSPKDRILALNYLVKFMRSPSLRPNIELVTATVKKLVVIGYTSAAEGSKELSKAVREQIIKILEPPSSKVHQWCDVVSDAIKLIANILPEDFFKSSKAKKDWENIVATLNELMAVEEKDSCQIIFVLVYANVALVLLEDAEVVDEIIEDLDKCLERSQKKMKKSKKRKSEVNEEEPAWVEVLTDLLLFMLGQEKSSLRNLCNVVWKLLIPQLTENAIKSVLDVLHFTSEDGKVYILPDKKKDGDVGEDEEEENSEDDEENLVDEEMDEDENAAGNDALIKLKLDLQKALGDNAALTDQESIDLDEVNDDVIQEMDSALGMAFKAHIATKPNKKPTKVEAKNTLARLHFKIRALDLVEIMLNQVTDSRLILMMLLAVSECYVEALKSTVQGELQKKLRNVLKLMKDWKPKEDSIGLDSQLIREKLMQLITIATQSPSRASEVSEVLSPALGCILKIAQKAEISASETMDKKNGKHLKKAFRMIENFLEDYGTGKVSVIPYNFVYKALTMAYKKRLELFTRLVDVCFNHGDIGKQKYLALMSILKKAVALPDLVSEAIEAEDSPLSNICKFSSEMFLIAEFCKQEHSEVFDILNTILPKMKNVEKMKPTLSDLENAVSQYQEKVTINKDSRESFTKLSAQLGVQYNKPKSEDRKCDTPATATTGKTKAQREKEKRNKKKIKKRQLKKKAKSKVKSNTTETASDMNGNTDESNEKPRYTNSITLNDEDSPLAPSKPNKKKRKEGNELEEIQDVQEGDKNPPQNFSPSVLSKKKKKVSENIPINETNEKEVYSEKLVEQEEEGKISTSSSPKKKKRRSDTWNGDTSVIEETDLVTSGISSTPKKKLNVSGKTPMKTPRK